MTITKPSEFETLLRDKITKCDFPITTRKMITSIIIVAFKMGFALGSNGSVEVEL